MCECVASEAALRADTCSCRQVALVEIYHLMTSVVSLTRRISDACVVARVERNGGTW